ncbi:hypothetical protein EJB05_26207, partial [Eragrostis curvula]
MDDGADPNAATGRSPTRGIYVEDPSGRRRAAGPFTAREALNYFNPGSIEPSHESLEEQSSRRRFRSRPRLPAPPMYDDAADSTWQDLLTGELLGASDAGFGRRRPGPSASATRSQASSSTAPPSDHPSAQRTGSGTRGRRSHRRRSTQHVEHPSEVGSSELEITNLPIVEALSASGSPGFRPDHSEVGGVVTGTRIRQSVLYSNRPRRPRRRQAPSPAQEHPSELSSSELGAPVTDLTLEALSLSDPPALTPQITGEETSDDDDDDAYAYDHDAPHEPIEFGMGTFGPQTLYYSAPRPKFKWLGGYDRGQVPIEELAADPSVAELDPSRSQEVSGSDSDNDTEEELRLLSEYLAANTCTSLRQAFDEVIAVEHAALTELAAERGIEPPPPRQGKHSQVHQESESLQAQQQPLPAAAQPQQSTAPRKARCEASNEELVENAENWMREEVKMVFEKYTQRINDPKAGSDCQFNELCHQCFSVESYNKIFHHYNFTVKLKNPNSVDWVTALYFAEVKQMFGRKYYFCCRLEPNENGHCYACKSQGVEDLQHPATGGFDAGSPNVGFSMWYE